MAKPGKKTATQSKQEYTNEPPFSMFNSLSNRSFEQGLERIGDIIKERNNILVLAGAGLSVSCGIPDFRSKNGLYATLDAQELGLSCAEDLFDLETFMENPQPFYRFAKSLYPGTIQPSPSHYFIKLLEKKKKLLRVYTQNIDGLENVAGISQKKIVYAHGSMNWARCVKCKKKIESQRIQKEVMKGIVPYCQEPFRKKQNSSKIKNQSVKPNLKDEKSCDQTTRSRIKRPSIKMSDYITNSRNRKRKIQDDLRILKSGDTNSICGGIIKPGVTFFGEKLDNRVAKELAVDRSKVDAVIVIGTSLSVVPMSKVIDYLPTSIPRILINRNQLRLLAKPVQEDDVNTGEKEFLRDGYVFDASLLGDCDNVTKSIVKQLGWENAFYQLYPSKIKSLMHSFATSGRLGNDSNGRSLYFESVASNDLVSTDVSTIATDDQENEDIVVNEIVHCDGCSKNISGELIMKCVNCFDYDLCQACYRMNFKIHYKGKHTFTEELC